MLLISGGDSWMPIRNLNKIENNAWCGRKLARTIAIAAIVIPSLTFSSVIRADDNADDLVMAAPKPLSIVTTSTSESAASEPRQPKKVGVVSISPDLKQSSSDDESYANSLKREQAKQEARKKTKSERARDLCETLGRGC